MMLTEIQVVISKAITKIQKTPAGTKARPIQHSAFLETKTREIFIKTLKNSEGDEFIHPVKVDFANPITAILFSQKSRFSFETKDGLVGAHHWKQGRYTKHEIDWT